MQKDETFQDNMADQKCRFCVVCGAKFTGRSSYKSKWRQERVCRANTVCRVGDRPMEPVQPMEPVRPMEPARPMESAMEERDGPDAVAVAGPSRLMNESSESAGASLVYAQVDPPGSDSSDDKEPPAGLLHDQEFPVWEEAQFDFNINLFPEFDFGYWEDGLPAFPPAAVREDVGPVNPFPEPDGEEDGFSVHPPAVVRINGGSEATRVEVAEAVHFAIGLASVTSE